MLCTYGRILGYLHGWFWICMHGSGFSCMLFGFARKVLDLHAWFWIRMHSIHKFFSFLEIYTGEFFHESILGIRHIDIKKPRR